MMNGVSRPELFDVFGRDCSFMEMGTEYQYVSTAGDDDVGIMRDERMY